MGTLIWRARKMAIQVVKNRTNRVIRIITMV